MLLNYFLYLIIIHYFVSKKINIQNVLFVEKYEEIIKELQPFIFINNDNINNTSLFNVFLNKYKEIYSYACECRKNVPKNEDVLCLKINYNIVSCPNFIFLIFDFQYSELKNNKAQISKLIEDRIILNLDAEYKLSGIISVPSFNHYKTIIFNLIGLSINTNFNSSKI